MSFFSRFQVAPPFSHGALPPPAAASAGTAIVLCNLGTPDAPTPSALRRYLAEFLSDPRVVEIPRPLWWLILHGIILRLRPRKSAAKYASIWTPEGSPLRVWTNKQAQQLELALASRGHPVAVRVAMRYGQPAIGAQLNQLMQEGFERVLVLPAYPQYSAATTASVFDAVYQWAARVRRLPELRFINHYHDHPGYIDALAAHVQAHWQKNGQALLVMSFHGVPQRSLHLGDPYHCECHKTARLLAEKLGLDKTQYHVTFQSRFGRAKWLEPYTEPTLVQLAQSGVPGVDLICPGFSSDCLETLEEIALEARQAFLTHGGQTFHYIAALNDSPRWISALADLSLQHLSGWPSTPVPAAQQQAEGQARDERARALGAKE